MKMQQMSDAMNEDTIDQDATDEDSTDEDATDDVHHLHCITGRMKAF